MKSEMGFTFKMKSEMGFTFSAFLVAATLSLGCVHAPPPVCNVIGGEQRPYRGLPSYLQHPPRDPNVDREPAIGVDERAPVVGHRALPAGERLARLHALLAAVDAHAYTIADRAGTADVRALELTLDEIATLLAPYPDLEYEVDELRALTEQIPSTPAPRLPRLRARMAELTDLIRLQLVAGA